MLPEGLTLCVVPGCLFHGAAALVGSSVDQRPFFFWFVWRTAPMQGPMPCMARCVVLRCERMAVRMLRIVHGAAPPCGSTPASPSHSTRGRLATPLWCSEHSQLLLAGHSSCALGFEFHSSGCQGFPPGGALSACRGSSRACSAVCLTTVACRTHLSVWRLCSAAGRSRPPPPPPEVSHPAPQEHVGQPASVSQQSRMMHQKWGIRPHCPKIAQFSAS